MKMSLSAKARLSLLGVLLVALTASVAPAATASVNHASPQHLTRLTYKPAARGQKMQDLSTNIFCIAGSNDECLNLQNCNMTAGIVQLYDWTTGYGCSEGFSTTYEGTVNPSEVWPFTCGDGLNSAYEGDRVFLVMYYGIDVSTAEYFVPISAGNDDTVTLGNVSYPTYSGPDGLWVEQDNNSLPYVESTRLIDAAATCGSGHVQHVYAGCGSNGCLVREGENPASDNTWDLVTGDYP
jgi:hypothetical protein